MPEHDPANTELVKAWFVWAHRSGLRPSIAALSADGAEGPRWRLSVLCDGRDLGLTLEDGEAPEKVRGFVDAIRLFDGAVPPFDWAA